MKYIIKVLFTLMALASLTSCYSTFYTYTGNSHAEFVGKTKNEILRTYGVPDKTSDDGNGGTILAYERQTLTTITNNTSNAYAAAKTYGAAVYNNAGIIGASSGRYGYTENSNGISETTLNKTYCYFYINKDNVAYDFKSNYGALYKPSVCYDVTKTWTSVALGTIVFFPSAIVTIPWAITSKKNAIKKGYKICN
jgi:hypothetical protein